MSENEDCWTCKIDWLNVLSSLGLESINMISEFKKDKVIKKISKLYGIETLMDLDPEEIDELVANELRELMKKEITLNVKKQEKMEKDIRSKMIPLKKGGIIRIDPRDFKDLDPNGSPEEIMKYFYNKLFGGDDDDDKDDDQDKVDEDNTGYYV